MRSLKAVSADEFTAFVGAYQPALTSRPLPNGTVVYEDTSDGSVWPDSLVASYLMPQPPRRPRASGYRIPA
jgi:hypothetical protein